MIYITLKVRHDDIPYEKNPELIRALAKSYAADPDIAHTDADTAEAFKSSDFPQESREFILYGHKTTDRSVIFCRKSTDELHVTSYPLAGEPLDIARHTWRCTQKALKRRSPALINPVVLRDSVNIPLVTGRYGRVQSLADPAKWTAVLAAITGLLFIILGKATVWDQTAAFIAGIISGGALIWVARRKGINWEGGE